MRKRRNSQGFTLIELMIVVAIIGLLASIAVPGYTNLTVRARRTELLAHHERMMTFVQAFMREYGRAPGPVDQYQVHPGWSSNWWTPGTPQAVGKRIPLDWRTPMPAFAELIRYGMPVPEASELRFNYFNSGGRTAVFSLCHDFDRDGTNTCRDGVVSLDEPGQPIVIRDWEPLE